MPNQPHVLVTGGAGFIGSHLVERLLADGKRITVVDDLSTGNLENLRPVLGSPGLTVIQSKLSSCHQLETLMPEFESIYHLAAVVGVELVVKSPIQTLEANLTETAFILELANRCQTPILIASTSEVYGKSQKASFSEDDDLLIGPPHFIRWSYACSKLMDEFLALAFAQERRLPVVIARLFNTVGPRQTGRYGKVLTRFIEAAKTGQALRVYGDGRQTRCFCYVLDTVECLIRLQNCPAARGEVFNVGTTDEITIGELAELVIRTLGSASSMTRVPYAEAYNAGFEDMLRRRPSIDKLVRTTQFQPATTLEQIINIIARA